jgi:hypothetical protein
MEVSIQVFFAVVNEAILRSRPGRIYVSTSGARYASLAVAA